MKRAKSLIQNINLSDYPAILDLGCGDGKITANFAASCPYEYIVRIDDYHISLKMIWTINNLYLLILLMRSVC
ncbi:MAG: class I SAM-dependent methyltransferase [Cyanobacteria bacterium P01_A01_bin.83]